jgi:Na+/melibiose symporter-like transporter
MVGPLLVLYFISGIAGVPLWFKLAQTRAKHRVWCLGMMLAMAAFAFAPFLGTGDVYAFAIVTVLTGLALGADVVMPASLQADVIDVDTARSGEERSALYLSLWGLATKLSLAAAVGIAFPLLALAGFDPGQNVITPRGLDALAFLYAGLPVIVKSVAIALMWRFPVDRAAQQELRLQIERRLSA